METRRWRPGRVALSRAGLGVFFFLGGGGTGGLHAEALEAADGHEDEGEAHKHHHQRRQPHPRRVPHLPAYSPPHTHTRRHPGVRPSSQGAHGLSPRLPPACPPSPPPRSRPHLGATHGEGEYQPLQPDRHLARDTDLAARDADLAQGLVFAPDAPTLYPPAAQQPLWDEALPASPATTLPRGRSGPGRVSAVSGYRRGTPARAAPPAARRPLRGRQEAQGASLSECLCECAARARACACARGDGAGGGPGGRGGRGRWRAGGGRTRPS